MAFTPSGPLDRFRQPEYTGRNRCTPCTAVNLVLAAVLAGGAAVVVSALARSVPAVLVGVVLFGLFAATIYLRGYLVPGTPRLTKTYFPDRVLRWFEKEPATPPETPDGELDVERVLQDAGAVVECETDDDLCLDGGFGAAWRDRIEAVRESEADRDDLAVVLDVDPEALTCAEHGDAFSASIDGSRIVGQWESRAAFVADMAAARELRATYDAWSTLSVTERSRLLNGLRIFLDRCPTCDGPVSLDREVVESCCRSIDVVAVTCEDCGARLFEAEGP